MIDGKPKYTLVGIFIVLSITVVSLTLLFFTSFFKERSFETYYILTKYSVPGLSVGAPVKYKGISVGKVDGLSVSKDQETVKIKMSINKNLNLKKDVVANLGFTGITGLSYVDLEHKNGVQAHFDKNLDAYVILMEPSEFQRISNYIPKILDSSSELIKNLAELTSSPNIKKIYNLINNINITLNNLNSLIASSKKSLSYTNEVLSGFKEKIDQVDIKNVNNTIDDYDKLSKKLDDEITELQKLTKSLSKNSEDFNKDISPQIVETLKNIRETSQELKSLTKSLKNHPTEFIMIKKEKPFPLEEMK